MLTGATSDPKGLKLFGCRDHCDSPSSATLANTIPIKRRPRTRYIEAMSSQSFGHPLGRRSATRGRASRLLPALRQGFVHPAATTSSTAAIRRS